MISISPMKYLPSSVIVMITVPPWSPSMTSMPAGSWKAAVHVPSASANRYMLPFSAVTSPPAKASPFRVKPPPSAVISVTVSPDSPRATSTACGWNGGGAGGGAGGLATGAGSLPHPARPNASITSAMRPKPRITRLRFMLLISLLSSPAPAEGVAAPLGLCRLEGPTGPHRQILAHAPTPVQPRQGRT